MDKIVWVKVSIIVFAVLGAILPMVDGANYAVSISSTGLLARPSNDIARKAIVEWR